MRFRLPRRQGRRRWSLGIVGAAALVLAGTVAVGVSGSGRPDLVVADAAAAFAGQQGARYEGTVIDRDGVATGVVMTVTADGAARGTLTREFGGSAEIVADGSRTLFRGNWQWWLWSHPGQADALADTWVQNPSDEVTGILPIELLTPAALARTLAGDGAWTETGERSAGAQRGLGLLEGERFAVVSADAPHRLLAIDVPVELPPTPVPRAYTGEAEPETPPGRALPVARFTIGEPAGAELAEVRVAAAELVRSLQEQGEPEPRGLDLQMRAMVGEAGEYGPRLLEIIDALTVGPRGPETDGQLLSVDQAARIVQWAVDSRLVAATHQLAVSRRVQGLGGFYEFMRKADFGAESVPGADDFAVGIGNRRVLERAALLTMDSAAPDGTPRAGHVVVVDSDYGPYKADLLDLGTAGDIAARAAGEQQAAPIHGVQMKTVETASPRGVTRNLTEGTKQLNAESNPPEILPPGAEAVLMINIERGPLADLPREELRQALIRLGAHDRLHRDGRLVVQRLVVTNHAHVGEDSGYIWEETFTAAQLVPDEGGQPPPSAGPSASPGPEPEAGGGSPLPSPGPGPGPGGPGAGAEAQAPALFAPPGDVRAGGALVDAARPSAAENGGIDFTSLELRYLADPGSGEDLRYAFTARPAAGGASPGAGLGAAEEASDAFFVWLALPQSTFWVNLNPTEPNRVVDSELGRTDVGRVLLEADLRMKKSVAGFIHPDTALGARYWDALEAGADGTVCTSFRQWIVPAPATVHEDDGELYILDAPLEVRMESEHVGGGPVERSCPGQPAATEQRNEDVFRTLILPEVQKAVNESPEYAELRRVYLSRVAAQWYRDRSLLADTTYEGLIDSGDADAWPSRTAWSPQEVFDRYVDSYTKNEFSVERERQRGGVREVYSYVYGGVDFASVPLQNIGAGEFRARYPELAGTLDRSFAAPSADGSGQIWLGSSTPPVDVGSRPGSTAWFGVIAVAVSVAVAGGGVLLVQYDRRWRRRRSVVSR